jgi:hypothetical protein
MELPEAARRTSDAQHGVIARYQLLEAMPEGQWADELIRSSSLEKVEHGVYRVAGSGDLPQQAAFAAALRARPRATISGPLALHLFQVPGFLGNHTFEVLTQPGRRLTGVTFTHRRDPDPTRAVASYGDVRTAGPLDALIDSSALRGTATDRDLRVAWDHLRARGLVTPHQLETRLAELRERAPGATVLADLLEGSGGLQVESEGERALAPIAACFDPPFVAQHWVTPGRRADFYSVRCRTAFEYVGEVDHAHVAGRIADDARSVEIREQGVAIIYITKHDLREPTTLVASIAARLTVRAHELGVTPPVAVRSPTA